MDSPNIFNMGQLEMKFLLDKVSAFSHYNIPVITFSDTTSVEVSDDRDFEPVEDDEFPKLGCSQYLILLVLISSYLGKVDLWIRNEFHFSHRYLHAANMVTIIVFTLFEEVICKHFSWSLPLPKMQCLRLRYALILVRPILVYMSVTMIMYILELM